MCPDKVARALLLLASAALPSCSSTSSPGVGAADSGAEHTFSADVYASATTEGGALRIDVRTDPQPPPRGVFAAELTVTDAAGAPQDGLGVSVVPWMPAMGHGASVQSTVLPEGSGKYLVSDLDLFMPGQWQLRVTFTGRVNAQATAIVTIP